MHAIPRGTSCNIPVSELAICIAILFLELVKETSPFLKTGIDTLHHFLTQSCSIAEHSIFLSCKNRAADSDAEHKLKAKLYADQRRHAKDSDIDVGDTVYLRKQREHKLDASFGESKFRVESREGTDIMCTDGEGRMYRRNVAHAKKCVQVDEVDKEGERTGEDVLEEKKPDETPKRSRTLTSRYGDYVVHAVTGALG